MTAIETTTLGWPRFGPRREWKRALESFWAGRSDLAALEAAGAALRRDAWGRQRALGIDTVPVNDHSAYDHVLDQAVAVGAVPDRFEAPSAGDVPLSVLFDMARGRAGVPAMEMTKWFDTNYHYIVPEVSRATRFRAASSKAVAETREARAQGHDPRPVLVGPVTFLLLSKSGDPAWHPLRALDALLPAYEDLLARLAAAGASWVQMDEPCLSTDLPREARDAYAAAYARLSAAKGRPRLLVASYFEGLRDNLDLAASLPADGLHVDLVRAPRELDPTLRALRKESVLSLGVVDGRNVWRADLDAASALVRRALEARGAERLRLAPSCSLLHVPLSLALEDGLDPEVRPWLAFAEEKARELAALKDAVAKGRAAAAAAFDGAAAALAARRTSARTRDPAVRARAARVGPHDLRRASPYAERARARAARTPLPLLPTTTIGSFPQTDDVRKARADRAAGRLDERAYEAFLREKTADAVRRQERIGLDVLVHGEFERNDMVEHFGERLAGFVFTRHGWVQSYGSRLVKPPILHGDVSRPRPMTVAWSTWAQSLTERPVKGMLTGPVTILRWSFVRDDQPQEETCRQIALAIRDEVADLERAGLRAVQIDEPAIREGLPLRRADRPAYLRWAVDAFRLASAVAGDSVQVHTHMCYSEFNEMVEAIAEMDADVLSIESSRSGMEILRAFERFRWPNEVGPGVYDIHSPRVPTRAEIEALLAKALEVVPAERLWVNPDCGLKTRRWEEVEPSLEAMVAAARAARARLPARPVGAPA
jgi:5-methyltetrahydropteroyltriglutamate--homocysteine methyltransferase